MPNYSRTTLKTDVADMISGIISDAALIRVANDAVREVVGDFDLKSTKRKAALSPNLFDDIYQYTCPSDLSRLIDINPQVSRGRFDYWKLVTTEEFNRLKEDKRVDRFGDPVDIKHSQWLGDNLVALAERDFVRKLYISRPIDDTGFTIDPLSAVGNWVVFGDGENLTKDSANYVKGSASLNWDISAVGGTTAGISNSSLDSFSIADYLSEGTIFVWAYITSATNLTNYILRIGSTSAAYYSITVTTNSEGNAFEAGWNLLRFSMANKSTTGSPTSTAITYVAIYMTKAAGKISETDYRFNDLIIKIGNHYDVWYYTSYGWQSAAGAYLENSTADTDLLNADTEEYMLIKEKMAELGEQYLKNYNEADRHAKKYIGMMANYKLFNPSEAMTLTQTYYDL